MTKITIEGGSLSTKLSEAWIGDTFRECYANVHVSKQVEEQHPFRKGDQALEEATKARKLLQLPC